MARRMHRSQARQGSTVGRAESLELGQEYSARPGQEASVGGLQNTSQSEDRGTEWIPNCIPPRTGVKMAKSNTSSSMANI